MRPSVTSATRWPRSCNTPKGGMSLWSSGMPLAFGPWKRTTAIKSPLSSPRLEGFLQFGLIVKDAHRRFDDEAIGWNCRGLDDRAAKRTFEHGKAARLLEGWAAIAQDRFIAALLRRILPREMALVVEPRFDRIAVEASAPDRRDVAMQETGAEQFADEKAHAAGRLEVVHVRLAIGIDAGEKRHGC